MCKIFGHVISHHFDQKLFLKFENFPFFRNKLWNLSLESIFTSKNHIGAQLTLQHGEKNEILFLELVDDLNAQG